MPFLESIFTKQKPICAKKEVLFYILAVFLMPGFLKDVSYLLK